MFKRVVIKISGEALSSESGGKAEVYHDILIDGIVSQIKEVMRAGTEVALVVGGGNIWRGRSARKDMTAELADRMGMLATVINGIYLAEAFKRQGVPACVATPFPVSNWTMPYEQEEAKRLIANGTVLINTGGLGHPWFSTDTVTALRAAELKAEAILFSKSVDGVYDKNPSDFSDAKKFKTLSYDYAIKNRLNVADMSALHLAADAGIASYVFSQQQKDAILLAASYPNTGLLHGTYVNNKTEEAFYVSPSNPI